MSVGFEIVSPAGADPVDSRQLAPRTPSLRGIRLGLLDNGKRNAGALLGAIGARLQREYDLQVVPFPKPERNTPLGPDTLRTLRQCDAIVNGVGD